MDWKGILIAVLAVTMSVPGSAADVESAKPPAPDGIASPSGVPSYFQGVWVGKWPWGHDGVELTITVGKKQKNGMFGTSYSWESGRTRSGNPIKPGSLKTWGKEQGDRFLIEWKNKEGVKFSITLEKGKEDSVKAVYDTEGTLTIGDRSDLVTYLHRK